MISLKQERIINKEQIHNFSITVEMQVLEHIDNSSYPWIEDGEHFVTIGYFSRDFYINSHGLLFYEVFDEF